MALDKSSSSCSNKFSSVTEESATGFSGRAREHNEASRASDCSQRSHTTGCQCATRCVRGCLDQCTTVFDTKGAAVAHGCYLKCTSECVRGCDGGDSDVESVAKRAAARALLA